MPNESRDRWSNRAAFILAAVGSAVGLGNIWRFPHVAYSAGGGAFLIPYFIALLTAGIPLLMLEYGLGHRMQGAAPTAMGRAHKRFEFAGWWAAAGGLFITFYYAIIIAWVVFYCSELAQSLFTGKLPWEEGQAAHYLMHNAVTGNAETEATVGKMSPINWSAVGFNSLVWGFIYYAIRNGVQSVGKVVWVTVLVPYLLLFLLFFQAINLEGASAGLSYYLAPDWSKLDTLPEIAKATAAAYGQVFFSLSIGFGIMMAYASFLPKKSDISNNAIITSFANSGTEFFGGFITFSVLGFLALNSGQFVGDVVGTSSFGVAFISYPTAIENIPVAVELQAAIGLAFFGSLLLLGVDSAFSLVEAMVAGVHDKFSVARKRVAALLCVFGWIVGFLFCNPGGLHLLDAMDHYLSHGLMMIGLIQCILIGWVFGTFKLRKHINAVSERRITWFWEFCIKWLTPIVLIWLLIQNFYEDWRALWDDDATFYEGMPLWINLIGLLTLVFACTVGFILARAKMQKSDYFTVPTFDYEDKATEASATKEGGEA